jgi:hypothetical protein
LSMRIALKDMRSSVYDRPMMRAGKVARTLPPRKPCQGRHPERRSVERSAVFASICRNASFNCVLS